MAFGYNGQGQLVWVDGDAPQGGTAMPTSYYAGKGGVIPMDPSDPRYESARKQEDNGFMSLAMGNPGVGKMYDGTGRIVNTSLGHKLNTGFGNGMAYGMAGLGLAAGGLAGGLALSGAYGAGAGAAGGATGGAFGGGGSGLAGSSGLASAYGGAGGAGAFGAGGTLGAASTIPTAIGSTAIPATVTGTGGAVAGGGSATTLGGTLAKKAAQTAAQKAAKKWMTAGAVAAPALAGLYAATRGKSGQPNDINQALSSLLAQQTEQMNQEQPLRRMLLSQQAGMLPTYMKQDPGYQQWLQSSAPSAAQGAMSAVARPRFA